MHILHSEMLVHPQVMTPSCFGVFNLYSLVVLESHTWCKSPLDNTFITFISPLRMLRGRAWLIPPLLWEKVRERVCAQLCKIQPNTRPVLTSACFLSCQSYWWLSWMERQHLLQSLSILLNCLAAARLASHRDMWHRTGDTRSFSGGFRPSLLSQHP